MDSVQNILPQYKFSDTSKLKIKLHRHGTLRLNSLLILDSPKNLNILMLLESLIHHSSYQELIFDHFTTYAEGYHGPFLVKNLSVQNFKPLSKEAFFKEFHTALFLTKLNTPMITKKPFDKVIKLLDILNAEECDLFKLDKCKLFNRNLTNNFDHEWSHALNKFYEFILYNKDKNFLYCLNLIYE